MTKGNKDDDHTDEISKDETIRRIKLLSVSQTAFLKDYIGKKLKSAKELVNSSLIVLKNEGASTELINSLAALDIESLLSVDVKSAQLMMHEEMSILRSAIENGKAGAESLPSTPPTGGQDSAASKEAIAQLETENSNLRGLLKELKEELLVTVAGKNQSDADARDLKVSVAGNNQDEANAKDAQITSLTEQLNTLRVTSETNESKCKDVQGELETANAALTAVQTEHAELKALQSSLQQGSAATLDEITALKAEVASLSKTLEGAQKELTQSSEALANQIKESEEKAQTLASENEAEKEEMMSAMAQELEETEEKHTEEMAAITKENKKLSKSLSKYKSSSKVFSTGLLPVQKNVASLSAAQKSLATLIKEEMQVTLKEVSSQFGSSLIRKLKQSDQRFVEITIKWKKEMSERKRLHNVVQELKGNIRVFMRCRPPSKKEIEQFGGEESLCVTGLGEGEVKVFNEKGREKTWEFDQFFGVDSTQEQVYAEVSDLIVSVLDGFNVCIFAYGQTGSGKTYTMTGSGDSQGVNIRALADLFDKAHLRSSEWNDVISVSVLEVYNEAINDLLVTGGGDKLEVKQGAKGNHVPGLTQVPVTTLEEVQQLLVVSDKNRSQASTNMNEHSSRSHMMMTVSITSEHRETHVVSRGKLNLVDLAGSERLDKSGATGQALKEAQNINKSLSALGDVIAARAMKQGHIPFRNSTLTYLLQDSLSQDSKTLMFVCASPVIYNAEETFCSLNFASRVRSVELGKASKNTSGPGGAKAGAPKRAAGR